MPPNRLWQLHPGGRQRGSRTAWRTAWACWRGGVAPASGITRVDKNLVVPQRGRPGTWRLLDTVRAFATERLQAASEQAHARERHLPGFATHARIWLNRSAASGDIISAWPAVTSGPPWRPARPPPDPVANRPGGRVRPG